MWSRRVVGWVMATHLRTAFVLGALEMAIVQGGPKGVDPSQRSGPPVHLDGVDSGECGPRWDTTFAMTESFFAAGVRTPRSAAFSDADRRPNV